MDKVVIRSGENKGKVGIVTGMFWLSGMCTVKLDDGIEYAVKISEIERGD